MFATLQKHMVRHFSSKGFLQSMFCSRYKITKRALDSRHDRYGLYVSVDNQVELLTSHLTIQTMTLLTRIGGLIGVGKEFLWIILSRRRSKSSRINESTDCSDPSLSTCMLARS